MRRAIVWVVFLIVSVLPLASRADIYVWTDENGVKHFTNYAPPAQARLLMKTPEVEYDETKDRERMAADSLQVQEQQWLQIAQNQAVLAYEQQVAAERIAEANRRAAETLRRAEDLLEEARQVADDDGFGYWNYVCYLPRYPYYYRKTHPYHRKEQLGGKYHRRPHASRWTKRDRGRDFSSRSPFDRSPSQSRYDRHSRISANETFRGNVSTSRDFRSYSRVSDRFGRTKTAGYRR